MTYSLFIKKKVYCVFFRTKIFILDAESFKVVMSNIVIGEMFCGDKNARVLWKFLWYKYMNSETYYDDKFNKNSVCF